MEKVRKYGFIVLQTLSALLILLSLGSLFYNNFSRWWIKVLNFPREQFAVTAFLFLVLLAILVNKWSLLNKLFLLGLFIALGIHLWFIVPFTFLAKNDVPQLKANATYEGKKFSLLIANVYMKNRNDSALQNIIRRKNPELVFLVEINRWWLHALQPLQKKYPYSISYPLDNTYGFVLYSKFPLTDTSILFLENKNVPSVHTIVTLPNHQTFRLHGIHPVPPVPSKYPDNIGETGGALRVMAQMVANEKSPTIVAGDFNDVAWSGSSRGFQTRSHLKDVRTGRGFYNSFNAHSPIFRWPLDHIFVSKEFGLLSLECLPEFGSDHFPIYAELVLKD